MGAPLLQLTNVTKTYGAGAAAFAALNGVSFEVAEREVVALVGPSGSGKSTLLNILSCLDQLSSGAYLFQGQDMSALDPRRRALFRRHLLGFVFQDFKLLARMTAAKNVEMPLLYLRVDRGERRRLALQALDLVGLSGKADRRPAELSGGQRQRVAIARALVARPKLILADEPTGNLDRHNSQEVMELFLSLRRDVGATLLYVTHDEHLAAMAGRQLHFEDGRVVGDDAG
ncbi:MAG TPA: ABC transporter ATP-binding protein [Rhizomicrobium sp.]|jgi:putative ABC transport system ATP-binding protein|nr:ABC transporter ATP-binding protein [Rhizomicrobium sp.]